MKGMKNMPAYSGRSLTLVEDVVVHGSRKSRKICVILSVRSDHPTCRPSRNDLRSVRNLIRITTVASPPAKSPALAPEALSSSGPLSYYVINVNSLAKPFAREQLSADLTAYKIDVAIISESKLKKHHKDQFLNIPAYERKEQHARLQAFPKGSSGQDRRRSCHLFWG